MFANDIVICIKIKKDSPAALTKKIIIIKKKSQSRNIISLTGLQIFPWKL